MSGEFEIHVDIPNSQFNETICINKYGDRYSLISGYKTKAGGNGLKWCYPQGKDKKASEKSVPWKINIGNRTDAIDVLKKLLNALGPQ